MKDNTWQYYCGNMVYNGDKTLKYLLFEEGLVNKSSVAYVYEYHLKDHLGNTRVTFQPNGGGTTTTQIAEYYPFGSSYLPVSPVGSNKYLYNGKEKQDDVLGSIALDEYDYGARFYDPRIGRWQSLDPLSEKMNTWSPYAYAFNNPINFIDYQGMIPLSQVVDNMRISSKFGLRIHPITGKLQGHGGVDFKTNGTGHEVRSLADGVVKRIGWDERYDDEGNKIGYGRYVIIGHKDGFETLYAHLESNGVKVQEGDKIKDGFEIGTSGNTGGSTGPHLHVEIGKGNILNKKNKIDPETIENLQTKLYGKNKNQESNLFESDQNSKSNENNFYSILKNLPQGNYKIIDGKLVSN